MQSEVKVERRGGARPGAGRKPKTNKVQSVVIRVPAGMADAVRELIATGRGMAPGSTPTAQLVRELALLRQDTEREIKSLKAQLAAAQMGDVASLRNQKNQLSTELFAALARLRVLEPGGNW